MCNTHSNSREQATFSIWLQNKHKPEDNTFVQDYTYFFYHFRTAADDDHPKYSYIFYILAISPISIITFTVHFRSYCQFISISSGRAV